MLFIKIGWQSRYKGTAKDPTRGGHAYLRSHKSGGEAWNFLPHSGKVYGYVPRQSGVNITRRGASSTDDAIADVTVVWVAPHPSTGTSVIVGWYRHATVYRHAGHLAWPGRVRRSGQLQIVADAEDAHLLDIDQRTLNIPSKKGGFGQSPVWYGRDAAFRDRVRAYIERGGRHPASKSKHAVGAGRQTDIEKRLRVEKAAIAFAFNYYKSVEGGERDVETVEWDKCGWDLKATAGNDTLKVEVKGVSGQQCRVELTPNEYAAMRSPEHRDQYVVFVVTGIDAGRPTPYIFRHDRESKVKRGRPPVFVSQKGNVLKIDEAVAARLSIAAPRRRTRG